MRIFLQISECQGGVCMATGKKSETRLGIVWIFLTVMMVLAGSVILNTETEVKAEETARTVKVAFPQQEGMSVVGENGALTGYNYEYLGKIAEYTGWKMEYVTYNSEDGNESVSNAMKDVEEGKADLLGPILKNEQTEKMFVFPEKSYSTVYTTLNALSSRSIYESNLKGVQNLKVGLWEKAVSRNEEVLSFLDAQNLTYEITYYEDSQEQFLALMNEEVDVISSVSLSPVTGTRIVAKFAPRSCYFVTGKGNEELAEELNKAIGMIDEIQPYLQDELFEKYFRNIDEMFFLTEEEEKYLVQMDSIRVLCVDRDAPYVYLRNGEPAGMLISVLDHFAESFDGEMEYDFCDSREEAEKKLKSGHYDMMIGLSLTPEYCAETGFIRSDILMNSGLAIFRKSQNTSQDTIAVTEGMENLIDTSSWKNVLTCSTTESCIKAVSQGLADAGAGDQSSVEYYTYDSSSSFIINTISGSSQEVCLAVSRECDMEFLGILNAYIHSLSDAEKTSYLSEANTHLRQISLKYYVRHYPVQTTMVVICLTVVCALIIFQIFYTRQMGRKNAELRTANEAKSEFLTRMSHDIRTPINGITGMLNISDRMLDDPVKLKEYHQKIRTASEYLLSLINDVLDMSKLESREFQFDRESADLREIITDCMDILEIRAAENGITMTAGNLDEFTPPRIYTSSLHLRQIFMNVIGNAIKYNRPNGKIHIGAEILKQTEETVTCRFTVEDNGIGMGEEFQKHMFEQFTQEHEDGRTEYKGTGLGLAIVKNIIEKMDGIIQIDSTRNVGTTVTWTLTFQIDRDYHKESEDPEQETEILQTDLSSGKILVVEDNDLNLEIIQFMLKDWGAQTVTARNGEEAVEAFAQSEVNEFDCILMDIMMPVMDGLTATRKIRSMDRGDAATVPVIAMSANAFAEDVKLAKQAGVTEYMVKPLDIEKLSRVLNEIVNIRKR